MRKFLSIATVAVLLTSLSLPAMAGDTRYHDGDAVAIGIFAGILGGMIAGAIISDAPRTDFYIDDDEDYRPRRRVPKDASRWVEKSGYEQSGRACPGPIKYDRGTYWCQIR